MIHIKGILFSNFRVRKSWNFVRLFIVQMKFPKLVLHTNFDFILVTDTLYLSWKVTRNNLNFISKMNFGRKSCIPSWLRNFFLMYIKDTVKAFALTPKMIKNSIIFREEVNDKGYKIFIADENLFFRILIYLFVS